MVFHELFMRAFGRHEGVMIRPESGFNMLYAGNEGGKSTLMHFVLAMFYGFPERKRSVAENYRVRFTPWHASESKYGGHAVFTVEGRRYRLERSFGSAKRYDRVALTYADTGTEVDLSGEEPGVFFWAMSREEFLSTVFIGQMESVFQGDDQLRDKVSQLTAGDAEGFPVSAVVDRLSAAQRKLSYRQKGTLVELKERRAALSEELMAARDAMADRQGLETELTAAETRLSGLRTSLDGLERARLARVYATRVTRAKQATTIADEVAALSRSVAERRSALGLEADAPVATGAVLSGLVADARAWADTRAELGEVSSALGEAADAVATGLTRAALQGLVAARSSYPARVRAYKDAAAALSDSEAAAQRDRAEVSRLAEAVADARGQLAVWTEDRDRVAKEVLSGREALAAFDRDDSADEALGDDDSSVEVSEGVVSEVVGADGVSRTVFDSGSNAARRNRLAGFLVPALVILGLGIVFLVLGLMQSRTWLAGLGAFGIGGGGFLVLASLAARRQIAAARAADAEAAREAEIAAQQMRLREEARREARREARALAREARAAERARMAAALADDEGRLETLSGRVTQGEAALTTRQAAWTDAVARFEAEYPEVHLEAQADDWAEAKAALTHTREGVMKAWVEDFGEGSMMPVTDDRPFEWAAIEPAIDAARTALADRTAAEARVTELEERAASLRDDEARYEANLRSALGGRLVQYEAAFGPEAAEAALAAYQTEAEGVREAEMLLGEREKSLSALLDGRVLADVVAEGRAAEAALAEGTVDTEMDGMSMESISAQVAEVRQTMEMTSEEISRLGHQVAAISAAHQVPQEIEEALEETDAEIAVAEQAFADYGAAISLVQDADEAMRQEFGPAMNEATTRILSALTGAPTQDVVVGADFGVQLEDLETKQRYEHAYFSGGRIDQVYLALRLAIVDTVYAADLPLFIDDALVQYDRARAEAALTYLVEAGRAGRQVVFATCHAWQAELYRDMGGEVMTFASVD